MPRGREISEDLKKRVVTAHLSGESYKVISNKLELHRSTVRQIIYKWRALKKTTTLPRSGRPSKISARAIRKMKIQVKANPNITSRDLQTSLAASGTHVHASTIRRKLNQHGFHGRVARKKPLLTKKNKTARLNFAREHLEKPEAFWKSILWTDESKIELFGHNQNRHVWRKVNTAYHQKNLLPTVKHGGGNVKIWACFSSSGPGQLHIVQGIMNSEEYCKILEHNLSPSVLKLKLGRRWIMQHDNDPKHSSNTTKEWLKKKKIRVLDWPSQSPDLNPIEMLWRDLKRAVHARRPSNLSQLTAFCKEEWAKIPQSRCERLISHYRNRLVEVISAKGGAISY